MENCKRKYDNSHWISIAAITSYYQLNGLKQYNIISQICRQESWWVQLVPLLKVSGKSNQGFVGSYLEALGLMRGKSTFRLIHVLGTNQFHVGTLSF